MLCLWEFSRQEYCSGWLCFPPGDLPNPGIKPRSLTLQADSSPSEPPGKPMNTAVGSLSLLQQNSQPRNWTRVSCIEDRFLISWATLQAPPSSFPRNYTQHLSIKLPWLWTESVSTCTLSLFIFCIHQKDTFYGNCFFTSCHFDLWKVSLEILLSDNGTSYLVIPQYMQDIVSRTSLRYQCLQMLKSLM